MRGLRDKVAIVSGGSSGIGRACVERLCAEGCLVVVGARDEARAREAAAAGEAAWAVQGGRAEDVRAEGVRAQSDRAEDDRAPGDRTHGVRTHIVVGDLRTVAECRGLVAAAVERFGRLDILVNNAGIWIEKPSLDFTEEDYDRLMDINLKGAFFLMQAAVRQMLDQPVAATAAGARGAAAGTGAAAAAGDVAGGGTSGAAAGAPAQRGVVVNTASDSGLHGEPDAALYSASKAGLIMAGRSLAREHGPHGIRVVNVCPGIIQTPLLDRAIAESPDPKAYESWQADGYALERIGRPEEVASVVAFAASSEASFVTGSSWLVDGGYMA